MYDRLHRAAIFFGALSGTAYLLAPFFTADPSFVLVAYFVVGATAKLMTTVRFHDGRTNARGIPFVLVFGVYSLFDLIPLLYGLGDDGPVWLLVVTGATPMAAVLGLVSVASMGRSSGSPPAA